MADLDLTPRQRKLADYLSARQEWVKSAELAAALGVTTRTVRSDIRDLAARLAGTGATLASSRQRGYKLSGAPGARERRCSAAASPVLPEERLRFILKQLIRAKGEMDIYELADRLAVSESTVESDLKRVRAYLERNESEVVLARRAELAELRGGERARRRLFCRLLLEEMDGAFLGLARYETYFPKIREIQEIVLEGLRSCDYALNEMAVTNLIVHIAITLERIRELRLIAHASSLSERADTAEYRLAEALCARFQERFGIVFPPQERLYLMYLLAMKKRAKNVCRSRTELREMVEPEFVELTEYLVESVWREFGIDLRNDESFFVGLTLHIGALCERVRHRGVIRNPLLAELKSRYPFTFEIAVFMAARFRDRTGSMILEDEIGFLTLHLGAALERLQAQQAKRRVALVCPSGSTSTELLLTKLGNAYGERIEVVGVFSFLALDEIAAARPEFIFATVDFECDLDVPLLIISPFLDVKDIDRINQTLNLWEDTAEKRKLRGDMAQYFSADCFHDNPAADDVFALLGEMSDRLAERGCVPPSFKASVWQRERISATSFPQRIAIPHAVEMNAYRTAISVARFDRPITWGGHKVVLVLLFAIRKGERRRLNDLYQYILRRIDRSDGADDLARAKDCGAFIERLLDDETQRG